MLGRKTGKPIEQVGLGGMCAETAETMASGADRKGFAKDGNLFCAVHQRPSQGSRNLIAHNDHNRVRIAKVMFQMVQNSSRVAHPGACHD